MKCKECEHWKRNDSAKDDKRFGECHRVIDSAYLGDFHNYEPNEFFSWDYEGYASGLTTGENFGCTHFKEKTDESNN